MLTPTLLCLSLTYILPCFPVDSFVCPNRNVFSPVLWASLRTCVGDLGKESFPSFPHLWVCSSSCCTCSNLAEKHHKHFRTLLGGHRSSPAPSSLSFLEDSWGFTTTTPGPRPNYPIKNWFIYVDSKMREPPKRAAAFGSTGLTVPICSPIGWKHVLCVSGLAYKNRARW